MQIDFHYCLVKVLAVSAGFSEEDAQVVSYACQHVDDATEHKGLHIKHVPDDFRHMVVNKRFEPVCTAFRGIDFIHCFEKNVQRKVYIPFHFLPSKAFKGETFYDYRVYPDSPLANELLNSALHSLRDTVDSNKKMASLIRFGIALHTFADTWSHQNFSGRKSSKENDIERIRIKSNGTFERIDLLQQMKHNAFPSIGHAEAMRLPDLSHLTWGYVQDSTGIEIERNNTAIYLDAAQRIYNIFCGFTGQGAAWKKLTLKIKECFSVNTDDPKNKWKAWKSIFSNITRFHYHEESWRKDSLAGEIYDWEPYETSDDYDLLWFSATNDLKWFMFHDAAREHRRFVLERIKTDLL